MTTLRQAPPASCRHIVGVGESQLHLRTAGHGPALVLIPALPSSVRADDPLFGLLARTHQVIAVDPPGHGLSDAAASDAGLAPFLGPLAALIAALGCGPVTVVGAGAGGLLALALRDARPDLVARVRVLDLPDAQDAEPAWQPPRIDGTHLIAAWDRIARAALFRPIASSRYADRIRADMPSPQEHHARLIDTLRAGAEGERLRLALGEIDAAALLARHADVAGLLDAAVPLAPDPAGRTALLPTFERTGTGFRKYLVDVPGGQLFARGDLAGTGLPLLGVHDQAGATRRLDAFVEPFLGARPVLSLDMPGSGGSDPVLAPEDISIETYADCVAAALAGLGIDALDVIGRYSGGQTAIELAHRRPGAVRHIVNGGVMIFDDADRAEHLAHYAPSIAPVWDGSHLVTAWMAFRSQNLWWPWYDRRAAAIIARDALIDPQALHDRIVDALAAGAYYRAAYHASFRYPMAERLRTLATPLLLTDIPATASYARVLEAKAVQPAATVADMSERPADWPVLFARFFADAL